MTVSERRHGNEGISDGWFNCCSGEMGRLVLAVLAGSRFSYVRDNIAPARHLVGVDGTGRRRDLYRR